MTGAIYGRYSVKTKKLYHYFTFAYSLKQVITQKGLMFNIYFDSISGAALKF